MSERSAPVADAESVPPQPSDDASAPSRSGRVIRGTTGFIGEVLLTVGVLLLLVVVYDLWWTNVVAAQNADQQRQELLSDWGDDEDPVVTDSGGDPGPPEAVVPVDGEAFALIYIPRLKDKVWGLPLVEGVSDEDLAQGISHFPGAALPGQKGNFALAGHRATHGEPLRDIDQLVEGDEVIIETETGSYVYRMTQDAIVSPYDVWVVDPVPGQDAGTVPTERIITLLTCNPRWASYERWAWWGRLDDSFHKDLGTPEAIREVEQA